MELSLHRRVFNKSSGSFSWQPCISISKRHTSAFISPELTAHKLPWLSYFLCSMNSRLSMYMSPVKNQASYHSIRLPGMYACIFNIKHYAKMDTAAEHDKSFYITHLIVMGVTPKLLINWQVTLEQKHWRVQESPPNSLQSPCMQKYCCLNDVGR